MIVMTTFYFPQTKIIHIYNCSKWPKYVFQHPLIIFQHYISNLAPSENQFRDTHKNDFFQIDIIITKIRACDLFHFK